MAGEDSLTLSRRGVVGALGATLALPVFARTPDPVRVSLAALEAKSGGRLGVAILDTATGRVTGHRMNARFGMCSTFKLPLAAVILREIDAGRIKADLWVPYGPADMVPGAQVTSVNLAQGGMTVTGLAAAAQIASDNVAANLLLKLIGGPAGFTRQLRALGDPKTRLDRFELDMNVVGPGEVRDTTTPVAMARLVGQFVTGPVLSASSKAQLIGWMSATRTGVRRIRAGLPADWPSGDKTGTFSKVGLVNKYNDVAVAFPPGRAPLIIAAYLDAAGYFETFRLEDETILAEVGRIVARGFT